MLQKTHAAHADLLKLVTAFKFSIVGVVLSK